MRGAWTLGGVALCAAVQHIHAPRAAVYRALLDARSVAEWMVPTGMTSRVHAFEARARTSWPCTAPPAAGPVPADNETGWRVSLAKLAALVEGH